MRFLGAIPSVRNVLTASLSALLFAACGDNGSHDATAPTLSRLLGTYDVSITEGPMSVGGNAIGVVERLPDAGWAHIRIDINTFDAIDVEATPAADGSLVLDGSRIEGVDAFVSITGTATIDISNGERRISATTADDRGERRTFVMVSPSAGTPASLAGSYEFAFDPSPSACNCSSAATLALSVKVDGSGALAAGTDGSAAGTVVGAFSQGTCVVSPVGRLRCMGTYDPGRTQSGDVSEFIVLQGALPAASGPGRGEFLRGSPPSLFVTGQWSATRSR